VARGAQANDSTSDGDLERYDDAAQDGYKESEAQCRLPSLIYRLIYKKVELFRQVRTGVRNG
jgi:hypothetical protein